MWHHVWFYVVVVVTPNQDSRSLACALPNDPARPLHSQPGLGCLSQHGRVLGIVSLTGITFIFSHIRQMINHLDCAKAAFYLKGII